MKKRGQKNKNNALNSVKTVSNTERITTRVIERYNARIRKDINNWRASMQMAENKDFPRRILLYNIHDDLVIDNHLFGLMQTRKFKTTNQPFQIVNMTTGEEDTERTRWFNAPWFFKFQELALDGEIFFGHSLIQFGDIKPGYVTEVELVPRRHVIPEAGAFLIEQYDTTGILYRGTPLMDFLIEVGEPRHLGLLTKAAPNALWKKNTMIAWAEYCEIFGMPIRVGTTTSRNQTDIDRMEGMLQAMGKAAYGVFNEGEKVEYIESTKGDAYKVYDMLIDRANKEMSKLILGSTMVTDDGSSRSQGEVHERATNDIVKADKRFIQHLINRDLFNLLKKHGWQLDGYEFRWDDREELNLLDQWTIDQGLLDNFEIEENYFIKKYGVPITGVKETPPPVAPPVSDPKEREKKKPERLSLLTLTEVEHLVELCCHSDDLENFITLSDGDQGQEDLLRAVWDKKQRFNWVYFNSLAERYINALTSGWMGQKTNLAFQTPGDLSIDYDTPDYQTITMMEANLFRFSAAKSLAAVNELNQLLPGNKTFEQFKKKAEKVVGSYNRAMETEYNFAYKTAQNAAEYHRMMAEVKSYPSWMYQTTGDSRVRESHKALDGKVFKADDQAFDIIYPPNGWGCRCYVKPVAQTPENYATKDDAIRALESEVIDKNGTTEYQRMVKGRFNVNRAKLGVVFQENQFYAKETFDAKLGVKDNGVKPFKEMTELPELNTKERDKSFASAWYDENVKNGTLTDYQGRVIQFTRSSFDNHLDSAKEGETPRFNLAEFIPQVLKNPDEVYLQQKSPGNYQYMYLKLFKDKPLVCFTQLDKNNGMQLKTWFDLDRQVDDRRAGILVKKISR